MPGRLERRVAHVFLPSASSAPATRHLLFPTVKMNPWLPRTPGEPGLLLRASAERTWNGGAQTVFTGIAEGKYRYVGEYTLEMVEPLRVEEWRVLGPQVRGVLDPLAIVVKPFVCVC